MLIEVLLCVGLLGFFGVHIAEQFASFEGELVNQVYQMALLQLHMLSWRILFMGIFGCGITLIGLRICSSSARWLHMRAQEVGAFMRLRALNLEQSVQSVDRNIGAATGEWNATMISTKEVASRWFGMMTILSILSIGSSIYSKWPKKIVAESAKGANYMIATITLVLGVVLAYSYSDRMRHVYDIMKDQLTPLINVAKFTFPHVKADKIVQEAFSAVEEILPAPAEIKQFWCGQCWMSLPENNYTHGKNGCGQGFVIVDGYMRTKNMVNWQGVKWFCLRTKNHTLMMNPVGKPDMRRNFWIEYARRMPTRVPMEDDNKEEVKSVMSFVPPYDDIIAWKNFKGVYVPEDGDCTCCGSPDCGDEHMTHTPACPPDHKRMKHGCVVCGGIYTDQQSHVETKHHRECHAYLARRVKKVQSLEDVMTFLKNLPRAHTLAGIAFLLMLSTAVFALLYYMRRKKEPEQPEEEEETSEDDGEGLDNKHTEAGKNRKSKQGKKKLDMLREYSDSMLKSLKKGDTMYLTYFDDEQSVFRTQAFELGDDPEATRMEILDMISELEDIATRTGAPNAEITLAKAVSGPSGTVYARQQLRIMESIDKKYIKATILEPTKVQEESCLTDVQRGFFMAAGNAAFRAVPELIEYLHNQMPEWRKSEEKAEDKQDEKKKPKPEAKKEKMEMLCPSQAFGKCKIVGCKFKHGTVEEAKAYFCKIPCKDIRCKRKPMLNCLHQHAKTKYQAVSVRTESIGAGSGPRFMDKTSDIGMVWKNEKFHTHCFPFMGKMVFTMHPGETKARSIKFRFQGRNYDFDEKQLAAYNDVLEGVVTDVFYSSQVAIVWGILLSRFGIQCKSLTRSPVPVTGAHLAAYSEKNENTDKAHFLTGECTGYGVGKKEIVYNLPTQGGDCGTPIFDTLGRVVAVHIAGDNVGERNIGASTQLF